MKIGISTASYFRKLQTEDTIPEIAAHHVPLCEIFLNSFCEYETDFVKLLKERLDETNLSVYSVHPMSMQFEPQLFSVHPRQQSDAMNLYLRVLADAKLLGATHYVMHGPARLSGAARNISLSRIAPILRSLSDTARENGVTLLLENVSWCIFDSPAFGYELASLLGDSLSYTLDVKQALRSGFDPLDYVSAVGARLENVHLCDAFRSADNSLSYCMPGYGRYDFAKLFSALAEIGYAGPAFLEVYSDMYGDLSELYDSVSRMQTLAFRM